ncbi:MAG: patatin-like phospholipase family protein [Ignavibacteriales bacterium]|nr:patatin-like phospholipase family protein [Ignavibacteriales bacterium]
MKLTIKILLFLFSFNIVSIPQDTISLSLEYENYYLPFGLIEKKPVNSPTIGIVLSGGGSRGISHLGVLKALVENNIPFTNIIGTSMGSIIGGFFSAGYSIDDLDKLISEADWNQFFALDETERNELFVDQKITEDKAIFALRIDGFTPVLPTSINSGQRVANFLNLLSLNAPLHNETDFTKLTYNFSAVSTDLITGNTIVLNSGSLPKAIRASSSVSFFLAPVKIDSMMLVDGGLVANIPVKIAKEQDCDIVITSNTVSALLTREDLDSPINVADQILSIPMRILNEQNLELSDIVITPNLNDKKNTDFSNTNEMIEEGYLKALEKIDSINLKIKKQFKKNLDIEEFIIPNLIYNSNPTQDEIDILKKFQNKNSVSNKDLLYEINLLMQNGDYEDVKIQLIPNGEETIFKLQTQKNPIINLIEIKGIDIVEKDSIFSRLQHLKSTTYNSKKILSAMFKVLRYYKLEGYSLTEIREINFDKRTGILKISLSEGIISEIQIVGNEKTNNDIIERELSFTVDSYFQYDDALKSLDNLRNTRLFNDVEFSISKSGDKNIIIIAVEEKISSLIRFGLKADNEYLTQVSMDIRNENIWGTGTEIGAIFSAGARSRSIIIEHKANRLFDTYINYRIAAFLKGVDIYAYKEDVNEKPTINSRTRYGEYRQTYLGASFGIGFNVGKFGNVLSEIKVQSEKVKNISGFVIDYFKVNIASLKFSLLIDSQDKYPYPDDGFLVSGYYETAQKFLGSQIGYVKTYFEYNGYFSISKLFTLYTMSKIGYGDNTLPFTQYFSLGGQYSFFGFREYEFVGRQIFSSSVGLKYKLPIKIFFETYAQIRYDLGSIWAYQEQIRFKDLKHGIGLMLSFDTPLGPADFSVGKSFYIIRSLADSQISWSPTFFYFNIGYYLK